MSHDSRPHITRLLALTGIVTCLLFIAPQTAIPQSTVVPWITKSVQPNGFDVQLPARPTGSPPTGLQLEVDSRWIDNFGYRPLHVTVTSPQPTTANHLVTIRLYIGFTDVISVEQDIDVPMGSTRAEATIACPQYRDRTNYWWEVWVDGLKRKDLSVEVGTGLQLYSANPAQASSGGLKFLTITRPQLDVNHQTINPGAGTFEMLSLRLVDLPAQWLDYTCFDVIALRPSEMRSIAESRPDAFTAICRWVRSGGQLWISPVGDQWEELSDMERLLKISAVAASGATAGVEAAAAKDGDGLADEIVVSRGWRPIKIAFAPPTTTETATPSDEESAVNDPPVDSLAWYVQQPLGLGCVRVSRKAWEPAGVAWSMQMLNSVTSPNESPPMPTPLSAALATTRNWVSRHGMAPDAANPDFANLLVPGVGLAPVTEFRILITLFVLAIGPVNYWMLKRWTRPHLMVITVPIMAALVTLVLFGYAILSDGFGTIVRVRSFLSLDERTGEAACWARLSYYAGLAPARGLMLPDDVAVYPIIPGWNETNGRITNQAARQLEWTNGEDHLTQGWLRSRTPTQYLTVRARKTPLRLELTPSDGNLEAKNELGTAITFVAATDGDGKLYSGEGLTEHSTRGLTPALSVDVAARLRTLVTDNMLVTPQELTDESTNYVVMQRRQRRQYFRSRLGLDYSTQRLEDNLMSGAISSFGGTNSDAPLDLLPRSFVAITETGPEVVTGVPAAIEEASFHVVLGRW